MEDESGEEEIPRFAHSIFGYDRYQVEEYLGRLQEWAADAHDRADEAERRTAELEEQLEALQNARPDPSHEGTPPGDSDAGAEPLLEAARSEADRIVAAAREQAQRIVYEAQRREADAGRTLEAARTETEQLRREAEQMRHEADRLRQQAVHGADHDPHGSDSGGVDAALADLSDELTRVLSRLQRLEQELSQPAP